jgi:cell division transport system permease protein
MHSNVIKNMIKEAFRGISRHPMITFASITTVTLMLIILGSFMAFTLNANFIIDKVGTEPPIEIWMREDVPQAQLEDLDKELESNPLVKNYKLLSPQEHYDNYRDILGDDASLIDSFDPALLPYSFTVQLNDPDTVDAFKEKIRTYPGIDNIEYSQVVIDFLNQASKIVNIASLISVTVLLLVSLLIISNMVRISILARSEEVAIMKYVGATNSYIRVPYLLEGAFTGIIGSLAAWVVVVILYNRIYDLAMGDTPVSSALALLPLENLTWIILLVLFLTGTLVGAVGSGISVRKHVNV